MPTITTAANEPGPGPEDFPPAPARRPVYDGDTDELLVHYDGQPCDPAQIEEAYDEETGEAVWMLRSTIARAA